MFKEILNIDEISRVANEIKELYKSNYNIVFGYYGFSIEDIERNNYFCRTAWCDYSQDKNLWYKIKQNNQYIINDIWIQIIDFYEIIRQSIKENTIFQKEIKELINKSNKILIDNMEKIIREFELYKNGNISQNKLFQNIEQSVKEINEEYLYTNSYPYSDLEIKDWNEAHLSLFATIHDVVTIYHKQYRSGRTEQNRMDCMNKFIKRYYEDLRKIEEL